jgi:hypothetical protein
VVIPTNRPIQRDDRQDLVYKTNREKYNAVIEEIEKLTQQEDLFWWVQLRLKFLNCFPKHYS